MNDSKSAPQLHLYVANDRQFRSGVSSSDYFSIFEWIHDGETYSFTGLTREILNQLIGRDKEKPLNGYAYWTHPDFGGRALLGLREANVRGEDRKSEDSVESPLEE